MTAAELTTTDTESARTENSEQRVKTFAAPASEWWKAIAFFITLALVGLRFYPALLILLILLIVRYRTDRYAFVMELMITLGGYGFMHTQVLPFKLSDLALIAGFGAIFVYHRSRLVSRVLILTMAYFAALMLIAMTSDESMGVQFVMMRNYFIIIAFLVPMLAFGNTKFEWDKFIHTLFLHELVICGLYALDTYLIHGVVLVPAAYHWEDSFGRWFYSSIHGLIWHPDLTYTPRHYPYGLYWMALCIIPLIRKQVRLSPLQWTVVILALISSKTMTFMAGLLICYVCFRGKIRQALLIGTATLVALTGIYFVDSALGSPLRVASTVDQFTSLEAAADNEDLAEFGSGRMAQILPKWELLGELNRYWLGFGFLHPTLTTNPKYQLKNEYYTDQSRAEETATAVEVTQIQTILDCGFLGLIIQTAFYVGIYFVIRRLRYSEYYLCAFVAVSVFGLGGFAGVTQRDGLLLLSTILAAIFLANPLEGRAVSPSDLKSIE